MKIIRTNDRLSREELSQVCACLSQGGVAALPTDTVYGLHCLADNETAACQIRRIKGRPPARAFLVLVGSYCQLAKLVYLSKRQEKYIRSVWPPSTRAARDLSDKTRYRPTTFVFKSRLTLPAAVSAGSDSLAVRLPVDRLMLEILGKIKAPLVSTSLNRHGQAEPDDLDCLEKHFDILPDLLLQRTCLPKKPSSSIIDIREIDNIKIIR